MITINAEQLGVHSEDQKKHQQMIACFQMGGELAYNLLPYMLHHRKVQLTNHFRELLNGNRQQKKKAEKEIEADLKSIRVSFKSLMKHLEGFSNGLGESKIKEVVDREAEISDAMYEYLDKLFIVNDGK